jgi:hypothetical protein
VKFLPSKVGADPKRVAILGGLVVVLVVVFILNRDTTPTAPASSTPNPAAAVPTVPNVPNPMGPRTPPSTAAVQQRRSAMAAQVRGGGSMRDFHVTGKLPEGTDVTTIDPRLKEPLLAKLQGVTVQGGSRSLFEFSAAPVAAPPPVAAIKPKDPFVGPPLPPKPVETPKVVESKPPVTPIPLKFYGFSIVARTGARTGFFLDGDEIVVRKENDILIRNRYRVVKIGVNTAVVEDTTDKHQETLKLIDEQQA